MKENFKKKAIGIIAILLFCGYVSAQQDSADFSFYTTAPVLNNFEDSVMYSGDGYVQLYLDFELADVASVHKIWVEVIQYDLENNASSIFIKSYTHGQLGTGGYITEGQVEIPLVTAYGANTYELVLRLEDTQGHESTTITKTILP